MEEKELKIQIPEGYEIDKENSTFECIKFKKKELTYNDICEKLFKKKPIFFINDSGEVDTYYLNDQYEDSNNCTSEKQAEKLLAINKLMNVAKYLNGDWTPDWNNCTQNKYYLYLSSSTTIYVSIVTSMNCNIVYFKTRELAEEAIKILGEETIKLALSTDY